MAETRVTKRRPSGVAAASPLIFSHPMLSTGAMAPSPRCCLMMFSTSRQSSGGANVKAYGRAEYCSLPRHTKCRCHLNEHANVNAQGRANTARCDVIGNSG